MREDVISQDHGTGAEATRELLEERSEAETPARAAAIRSMDHGDRAPTTTSAGRFLDAIAALLDVARERSYEGEPAMRLESVATEGTAVDIEVPFDRVDGRRVVDAKTLADRLATLLEEHPTPDVASTAQDALARGLAAIAIEEAERRGVDAVGFSGGVSYNDAISRTVRRLVTEAGLEYLDHRDVPPGDAGIAYGQAIVATARTGPR
ncbi:MAG: hypothetical protein ABEJ60_01975 [Halodesulfurarchaeum sp.]